MFRKLIEQQIEIENIPFFKQMFQTDIIVFLQQVNITVFSTSSLARCIGQPVARTGRNSYRIRKPDIMIHKIIKHAASKYSAHSPALQHQPCRFINFQVLHLNLPNFIFISLYIPRFITVCCIYIIKTNKKGRTFGKNSKYLNKTLLFCFNLRNFRLA